MYARDTIAALSTAGGSAAVAVVRISGPDAASIAARVFRSARSVPPEQWQSHRMYRGRFVDRDDRTLDHGLAVLMRTPHSYTGEDVLELHGHGGGAVVRTLLAAVLAAGARAAERGEFTSRAFLNGKLDLAQAEAVADLIAAPTDRAARAAAEQLGGSLSRVVERLRERLVGIAAHLEASIDFSEEDIGELDRGELAKEARAIAAELRALAATHARGRVLREGLHVALVGKPNVGKSSLLNRLLGSERAIVTPTPGTTRDVIEEAVDVDGVAIVVADTAGIRSHPEEVEKIGIGRTLGRIERADVVLAVFDNSRSWEAEDDAILGAVRQKQRILLINKSDLPSRLDIRKLDGSTSIHVSALSGEGVEPLKAELVRHADLAPDGDGTLVFRERQKVALESAAEAADRGIESITSGRPADLIAVDIMIALDHLGEIVGHTSAEVVLDRIFSEFCIGK